MQVFADVASFLFHIHLLLLNLLRTLSYNADCTNQNLSKIKILIFVNKGTQSVAFLCNPPLPIILTFDL